MKKSLLLISITALVGSTAAVLKEDGRAGATGSPGETTCNTTQCHNSYTLNSGGGSISISAPTMTNWAYVPGQTYPISVTVSKTGTNLFGLGVEALRSTGANGGSFTITNPSETQLKNAAIGGNIRSNVVHQLGGGASSNSHTFTFNWNAPSTNIGNITFYAAGNAANDDGDELGDYIYTTSQVVTFATGLDNESPAAGSMNIYPNPVHDRMRVDFGMREPGLVQLNLYSLQGKFIKQLFSELFATGEQQVTTDIKGEIPPGIYLLELNADGSRSTVKMVKI